MASLTNSKKGHDWLLGNVGIIPTLYRFFSEDVPYLPYTLTQLMSTPLDMGNQGIDIQTISLYILVQHTTDCFSMWTRWAIVESKRLAIQL